MHPIFMQATYNSQEVTSMPISRAMDEEDVVHMHSGLLLSHRLPRWVSVKEPTCHVGNVGDIDSISGSGSCPGRANGKLLQYSYLQNPMDRGT